MGGTDAEAVIGRYIDRFYNSTRQHSLLDFVSPATYERQAAV
jgi:transposase InsO family protein